MAHVCNFDNQITFTFPDGIYPSAVNTYSYFVNNPTGRQYFLPAGFNFNADVIAGLANGAEQRISSLKFTKLLSTYKIYFDAITFEIFTNIESVGNVARLAIVKDDFFNFLENENNLNLNINIPLGTATQKNAPDGTLSYYHKVKLAQPGSFDIDSFLIMEFWLRTDPNTSINYTQTTFHNLRYKAYK